MGRGPMQPIGAVVAIIRTLSVITHTLIAIIFTRRATVRTVIEIIRTLN